MFEKASRLKLRFDTLKGSLLVDDVWDLPLTSNTGKVNLDDLAKGLHEQLEKARTTSFVNTSAKPDDILQLKFDIVLHVIKTKKAENEATAAKRAKTEKKEVILAAYARKQNEQLEQSSLEDLKKMLDELGE